MPKAHNRPKTTRLFLVDTLGEGTQATVKLARDAHGAEYALKIPHKRASVRREAEILSVLRKHGIRDGVPILHGAPELDGYPCLLLELLGPDLHAVRRRKPFCDRDAVRAGLDVLSIVRACHSAAVVHGDLFDGNVCVGRAGTSCERDVFLIDFGNGDYSSAAERGTLFARRTTRFKRVPLREMCIQDVEHVVEMMVDLTESGGYLSETLRWNAEVVIKYLYSLPDDEEIDYDIIAQHFEDMLK